MKKKSIRTIIGIIALVVTTSLAAGYVYRYRVAATASVVIAHTNPKPYRAFPAVDTRRLSAEQIKIIGILRTEYAKHPLSFDNNVLVYTQGNKQAWCADYLSWVMLQAGIPFSNPNSGSWRIPGVFTVQQYYQNQHRYHLADSYIPQVGDAAIHIGHGQHVNIVIKVEGHTMTTIGGNEGGKMLIDTQAIQPGANDLVGFGTL